MRRIFTRDSWLEYFKRIEMTLLEALVETNIIKEKIDFERLEECFSKVSIKDVEDMEKIVRHETMAVVRALSKECGELGKYIHLGATSNDILDTIMALQLKEANTIVLRKLRNIIETLRELVEKYKDTPLLGRTHGRAAIPTTYGFRLAIYLDELYRSYLRISETSKLVLVGKLGGAIGTQVELYPYGEKIEKIFLKKLGLGKPEFYTQVIPRDRLAYYLNTLIILSSVLEHLANEIRIMQRSGIEEAMEEFGEQQVGSSVMPHKRNPIMSERVCGISRKLRALASSICENIVLEDERDLRNSSFERSTIPEILILLDEQLDLIHRIIKNLRINTDQALTNIRREEPYIYSDLLLQHIAIRGGDRQVAHEKLRRILTQSPKLSTNQLKDMVMNDPYLSKYVDRDEIDTIFSLEPYIKAASERVDKILQHTKITYP